MVAVSVEEQDSSASTIADNHVDAEGRARAAREEERKNLAAKEDKMVRYLRWAVIALLVFTAAIVSTGVFLFIRNDQDEDFEKEFEAHADKMLESFYRSVERKFEALEVLSVGYTSVAHKTGATFPNVTLPDFEIRASGTRVLGDTSVINYHPIITDETRAGWEAYQVENRDHINEAFESGVYQRGVQDAYFKPSNAGDHQRLLQENPLKDEITNFDFETFATVVAPKGSGPYLPIWQLSPVVPGAQPILNLNVLSHLAGTEPYKATMATGLAVLGEASNLDSENLGTSGDFFRTVLSFSQYRYGVTEFLADPTSSLGYPVFDSFVHETRAVAGVISTNIFWKQNFENVLPKTAKGIICVVENTVGQKFTYRVDGKDPSYLGAGDLHNSKYDSLGKHGNVSSYLDARTSPQTSSYTSVPLDTSVMDYILHVYPSGDTEGEFKNNGPVIALVVVASVFLFTSLVFISYDCFVRRRQTIVMNRAIASGAIVSSLFPSQVRDKIYEENEDKPKNWTGQNVDGFVAADRDEVGVRSSRPIAEKYENTTILFADLAGFTQWSSSRTPEQVFELLETIYSTFDKVALRRKVFKVETIGDCYVAVTGLPDPQPDHAVIMCKFAQECMEKLTVVLNGMIDSLGPDTATLAMRVGCHSGPVTGGVLRGDKGRFQLFGDSMNTAARMESNGVRGRIHVSEATKNELIAKGRQSWVTPREEKVLAKGKGEMQTYFVTPSVRAGSAYTTRTASSEGVSNAPEEDTTNSPEECTISNVLLDRMYKDPKEGTINTPVEHISNDPEGIINAPVERMTTASVETPKREHSVEKLEI